MSSADGFEAAAQFFEMREEMGELVSDDGHGGRCYQRQDGNAVCKTYTEAGAVVQVQHRDGNEHRLTLYQDGRPALTYIITSDTEGDIW